MTFRLNTAVLATALLMSGCASAVDGSTQPVFVTTTPVTGAACTCSNERGKWTLVTPGTVVVKKSESVLQIHCTKPGWRDGTAYAAGKMSTAGMVGMALPYVGLLAAVVDSSTGAATSYPDTYTIELKPAAVATTPGSVSVAAQPAAAASSPQNPN